MEYTFGTLNDSEVLKTKGEEYTDLSDWQEVVQEYPDCIRRDRFRVVERIHQDEDVEGNRYTWYEISNHNTAVDKTPMLEAKLDYITMMTGVEIPEEGETNDGTQSEV
jgi:hypothetical protein